MRNIERRYRIKYMKTLELPYLPNEEPLVVTNLGVFPGRRAAVKYLHYKNGDMELLARLTLVHSQPEEVVA